MKDYIEELNLNVDDSLEKTLLRLEAVEKNWLYIKESPNHKLHEYAALKLKMIDEFKPYLSNVVVYLEYLSDLKKYKDFKNDEELQRMAEQSLEDLKPKPKVKKKYKVVEELSIQSEENIDRGFLNLCDYKGLDELDLDFGLVNKNEDISLTDDELDFLEIMSVLIHHEGFKHMFLERAWLSDKSLVALAQKLIALKNKSELDVLMLYMNVYHHTCYIFLLGESLILEDNIDFDQMFRHYDFVIYNTDDLWLSVLAKQRYLDMLLLQFIRQLKAREFDLAQKTLRRLEELVDLNDSNFDVDAELLWVVEKFKELMITKKHAKFSFLESFIFSTVVATIFAFVTSFKPMFMLIGFIVPMFLMGLFKVWRYSKYNSSISIFNEMMNIIEYSENPVRILKFQDKMIDEKEIKKKGDASIQEHKGVVRKVGVSLREVFRN